MRYYASAETMAESLALPLLLRADVDPRFLERHDRLSAYAAERPHAARLHHRALAALGADSWKGKVIWVTGPWGSLEHLPWAVGLAEQMTDQGLRVYLGAKGLDLPVTEPGGRGEQIPGALGEWVEVHLKPGLVSFATDLAGVRALGPGQGSRTAPMSPAALILADALPEELEGPYPDGAGIDATVLVAAFRDHGVHELESVTRGLLAAGHRLVGLVALGPEDGTGSVRPGASQIREPLPRRDVGAIAPPAASPPKAPPPSAPPPSAPPPRAVPSESSLSKAQEMRAKEKAAPPSPSYAAAGRGRVPGARDASPSTDPPRKAPEEEPRTSIALPSVTAQATPPEATSKMPAQAGTTEKKPTQDKPAAPSPPTRAAGAVPLFASWEAETRRHRRVRGIVAALALIGLLGLGSVGAMRFAARHGWIGAKPEAATTPQPSSQSVASPEATAEPPARGAESSAAADRIDSTAAADRIDSTAVRSAAPLPSGAPAAALAPGLEASDETPAPGRASAIDAFPKRPFPWGEPKRAVAAADTVAKRRSGAADSLGGGTDRAGGDYVVHLSSFRLEREAETEVENLAGQGIDAHYLLVDVPEKGAWYRVVTGRFATFPEAEAMAMRLCRLKGVPRTHVAGLGGRGAPVPVDSLAGVPAASRPRMD